MPPLTSGDNTDAHSNIFHGFSTLDPKDHRLGNESIIGTLKQRASAWYESRYPTLKGGLVRKFSRASTEYLRLSDASGVRGSTALTVAAWVKTPGDGVYGGIVDKLGSSNREFLLNKSTNDKFFFQISLNGSSLTFAQSSELADDTWQFVVGTYDGVNVNVCVNAGTVVSTAATGTIHDGGARTLDIGRYPGLPFEGLIGPVGVWDRALTLSEITDLYNAGVQKQYSDLTTAERVGLKAFWNMNEESGDAYDSVGSNDLSDNNTVTSENGPTRYDLTGNAGVAFAQHANATTDLVRSFDSSASEYLPGGVIGLNGYSALSLSSWVKFSNDGANRAIMSQWLSDTQFILFKGASNTFIFRLVDSSGTSFFAIGPSTTADDVWRHVAVIWDGVNITLYVDGVAGTPVAIASVKNTPTASFSIGAIFTGSDYKADGEMHGCAIWTEDITASRVSALYNSGTFLTPLEMLDYQQYSGVSYWPLNEPSGDALDLWGDNDLADTNTVGSANGPSEYLAQNGAGVTSWPNRFGSFGDLTTQASEIGLAQTVDLDGVIYNDSNRVAMRAIGALTRPNTLCVVFKGESLSSDMYLITYDAAQGSGRQLIYRFSNTGLISAFPVPSASPLGVADPTIKSFVSVLFDAAASKGYSDSGGETAFSNSPNDLDGISVGGNHASGGTATSWSGQILAVVAFPSALTLEENEALQTYFGI